VFVQWLPLHQLDPDTLRTIVATFLDVFPDADSWLALYNVESPALGLFGTVGEAPLVDIERLRALTADPAFASVVLQDPRDLLAGHMLDATGLASFAAQAPVDTDLRPRVLFDAARTELGAHPGITNLELLLPLRSPFPEARLAHAPPELVTQTASFARALDHYLAGEILFVRHARAQEPMPDEVVEQYVAAYEAAPEFLPVRGRLRAQIALLQRNGLEDQARALVQRLELSPP
jgi:spermidine synthase